MRRSSLFWGSLLILAGSLFLLSNLGILRINVWNTLWPLFLVALGVYILLGVLFRRSPAVEQLVLPLEDARRARLNLRYGAGRLVIGAGAAPGHLVEGEFTGGVEVHSSRKDELLDVTLSLPSRDFPWSWNPGELNNWTIRLAEDVPLFLQLSTGANEAIVDLQSVCASEIQLNSGASDTLLTLPEKAGFSRVRVEAGAASVRIRIPANVAARIQAKTGLSSISIDTGRFPFDGKEYRSADYDTAENKAELAIQAGVGAITIQ